MTGENKPRHMIADSTASYSESSKHNDQNVWVEVGERFKPIKNEQLELFPEDEMVSHPPHYLSHPSGIECIDVTEHMNFNMGNATKYIWRCDDKGDPIENLKKAAWYIDREIKRREKAKG